MKTAILYSGHARTFARTFANHRWMLWRHFQDVEIFASLVDDKDGGDMAALLNHYMEGRAHVELVTQPEHIELPAGCPPESTYRERQFFMHEPYWISVPPQAVLKQLWHLQRVWDFACESGRFGGPDPDRPGEFDTFIRCRPDLWFHSLTPPNMAYARMIHGRYQATLELGRDTVCVPWWGRFGGVNDRFAIMGRRAAGRYFKAFGVMPDLIKAGAPLHPESLVAAAIGFGGMSEVRKIPAEFSTLRATGEMRGPEITAGDIAEGLT